VSLAVFLVSTSLVSVSRMLVMVFVLLTASTPTPLGFTLEQPSTEILLTLVPFGWAVSSRPRVSTLLWDLSLDLSEDSLKEDGKFAVSFFLLVFVSSF
jgi:hypothetical protein